MPQCTQEYFAPNFCSPKSILFSFQSDRLAHLELTKIKQKTPNDIEQTKKFDELMHHEHDLRDDIDGIKSKLRNQRKLFSNRFNEIVESFEAQHSFGKYANTIDEIDQQIQAYQEHRATLATMKNEHANLAKILEAINEKTDGALMELQWLNGNDMRQLNQFENERSAEQMVVNQIQWHFQIQNNNIALDDVGILANLSIEIDPNVSDARFDTAINDCLNQGRCEYDDFKQIVNRLINCIGYNCKKLRLKFNAAKVQLVKTWSELKQLQQQRAQSLYEQLVKLAECFKGIVERLRARVDFPFAPQLDFEEVGLRSPVSFLVDTHRGMPAAQIHHQFAANMLKIAISIVTDSPIIIMDNMHSIFDDKTFAVLMEYFGHLVKYHNKQVICITSASPSRLDDVSSVHLLWDNSSVCIEIGKFAINYKYKIFSCPYIREAPTTTKKMK